MNIRSFLREQLAERAYKFREEPFKLKSGRFSNHYVDCRGVLMDEPTLYAAARLMLAQIELMDRFIINGVAGVVLGSISLVDKIMSLENETRTPFDGFIQNMLLYRAYVRPEEKDHGTKRLVEMSTGLRYWLDENKKPAPAPNTLRAAPQMVLVEDVWTTGGSATRAKAALEAEGIAVVATLCVVDREELDTPAPDFSLFKLHEFVKGGLDPTQRRNYVPRSWSEEDPDPPSVQ